MGTRTERLVKLYAKLPRVECQSCKADSVPEGSTCAWSITCPTCGANPHSGCLRPSGHRAMTLHRARVDRAEDLDLELLS